MYIKNTIENKYYYIGKINDSKWEFVNHIEDEVEIISDENYIRQVKDLLLKQMVDSVYNEMRLEDVMLATLTREQILELFEVPVNNLLFG